MLPSRNVYSNLEQAFLADADRKYSVWQATGRRLRLYAIATTVAAVVVFAISFVGDVTSLSGLSFVLCGTIAVTAVLRIFLYIRHALEEPRDGEAWQAHFTARGFKPGEVFEDPPPDVMKVLKRQGMTELEVIDTFFALSRVRLMDKSKQVLPSDNGQLEGFRSPSEKPTIIKRT